MSSVLRSGIALLAETARRATALTLVDQAFFSVTTFLTGVVIARACEKSEFGLYHLCFTLVVILKSIPTAGLLAPYTVYVARLSGRARRAYTGSTLIQQLALGGIFTLLLILASLVMPAVGAPSGLDAALRVVAVVITLLLLREFARYVSFAQLRAGSAVAVDAIVAVLQLGGLAILALIGILTASTAYGIIGTASGLGFMVWLARWRPAVVLGERRIAEDVRQHWRFGRFTCGSSLALLASASLYPWLLAAHYDTESAATFGACLGIAMIVNPVIQGVGNAFRPLAAHAFAEGGMSRVRRIVLTYSAFLMLAMGLITMLLLLFGGLAVGFVYGRQYAGQGAVVAVLAIGNVATALADPVSGGLMAVEKPHWIFASALAALLTTLLVGGWLVGRAGVLGAACGASAAMWVACAILWVGFAARILRARSGRTASSPAISGSQLSDR